jgi:hypothetical protein
MLRTVKKLSAAGLFLWAALIFGDPSVRATGWSCQEIYWICENEWHCSFSSWDCQTDVITGSCYCLYSCTCPGGGGGYSSCEIPPDQCVPLP